MNLAKLFPKSVMAVRAFLVTLFLASIGTTASAVQYEYDPLNRLIKVRHDDGVTVVRYVYDEVGNRVRKLAYADTDYDDLSDAWELDHFGSLSQGSDGDPDRDRLTNLDEFLLGTKPNDSDTDGDRFLDGEEVTAGTDPLDKDDHPPYIVYAPWFYENVAEAGDPLQGQLTFISVVNISDEENMLSITYLSPGGTTPDEGPYDVTVGAGDAIAWSPYSDAGGAEMSGIPNASFAAGSVKIEATHPIVGRVIHVDATSEGWNSMGAQPLVKSCWWRNEDEKYEVYVPWFYESVAEAGDPLEGQLTFISVVNASDEENMLSITYLPPSGIPEGPYEVTVDPGDAIAWSPYSDAGGAEMPEIPNASFAAGSVRIEGTQPIVGRVIHVDATSTGWNSMGTQPLVRACDWPNEQDKYEVYAPWFYESVAEAGNPLSGKLAFICVRNTSDEDNTLLITYLSGAGDEEGPHEAIVPPGGAIAWSPYSDAGEAEMPGIPNASFDSGSVKIESTHPIVGRVIQLDVHDGTFVSMGAQALIEACNWLNEQDKYEVYVPWFYESVAEAGDPLEGKMTFVCVRNTSDEEGTLLITYLSGAGDEEGPHEVIVPPGCAIAWSPYSDAGEAEMPGIPNASFDSGSVKIEATHPIAGRVMHVDATSGGWNSVGTQPVVE